MKRKSRRFKKFNPRDAEISALYIFKEPINKVGFLGVSEDETFLII